jgi:rare lipoprotein A
MIPPMTRTRTAPSGSVRRTSDRALRATRGGLANPLRTVIAALCAGAVAGMPLSGPPPAAYAAASASGKLGDAAQRAMTLQQRLEDLTDEQDAIQFRLDASAARLAEQTRVLGRARDDADRAQAALHGRVVAKYKADDADIVTLLFASASWDDLSTRADMLLHLVEADNHALAESRRLTSAAEKEVRVLSDLRKEDLTLRGLMKERVASANKALAEQKLLVATLTEDVRKELEARKAAAAAKRKKWAASSVKKGSTVRKVPVTVSPYSDRSFMAPDYFPKSFRVTGKTFTGLASWYGAAVDGHRTASGRIFNHDDYTCAHRSLPFGTCLAVTRGKKRIVVVVTDRGPYTGGRVLDLSEAAAKDLGIDGVSTVRAEVLARE